tara:strand:- start:164 stop:439 length:276 start_codon:yes stop_codon:yes gene_type:complete
MSFTSYELSSHHPDPEGHLEPIDWSFAYESGEVQHPTIRVNTHHSAYMPECVARHLHDIEVRKELDGYFLNLKPEKNYEVYRCNDDYELPF